MWSRGKTATTFHVREPPPEPPPNEFDGASRSWAVPLWEELVIVFVSSHDPSRIINILSHTLPHVPEESKKQQASWPMGCAHVSGGWHSLLHSINSPSCYNIVAMGGVPLIMALGASVCISPRCEYFITYRPSKVRLRTCLLPTRLWGRECFVRWYKTRMGMFTVSNFQDITFHRPKCVFSVPKCYMLLHVENLCR